MGVHISGSSENLLSESKVIGIGIQGMRMCLFPFHIAFFRSFTVRLSSIVIALFSGSELPTFVVVLDFFGSTIQTNVEISVTPTPLLSLVAKSSSESFTDCISRSVVLFSRLVQQYPRIAVVGKIKSRGIRSFEMFFADAFEWSHGPRRFRNWISGAI